VHLKNQLLLHWLIPFLASNSTALTNGLPVKKTLNASLLFKTARRNVEQVNHAGLFAFQEKVVKPPLM